jgi:hypothetical protein|tara:strand:- start:116 stop:832 length:717 start_codon:yes stop_codon:yes gene_type:complete
MNDEKWGDSRWEFTKSQSQWHFDEFEPGERDFQYVGTFQGDWSNEIDECLGRVKPNTWANRNIEQKSEIYTASQEQNDLIKAGADPDSQIFSRANAKDIPIFQRIANYFGMNETAIKFHNQTTGQMLHWHIDNFAGRKERGNSFTEIEADKNPHLMRRFAIMLDDWKHGQVFALGNTYFHQWKKGECITWEWRDIPHATCNMGWNDRPMLQVTGWTTETTHKVVKEGRKNKLINVNGE